MREKDAAARNTHAAHLAAEENLVDAQRQAGRVALRRIRGSPDTPTSVTADHRIAFRDDVDYVTIGAPACTVSARGFYEVTLSRFPRGNPLGDAVEFDDAQLAPQFGWVGEGFELSVLSSGGSGVGDDAHGWGLDGERLMKWHSGSHAFPEAGRWVTGDVLGFAADCVAGRILFARNGVWCTAFEGIEPARMAGLYPALSGEAPLELHVNLGDREFVHGPPDASFLSMHAIGEQPAETSISGGGG